MFIDFSHFSGKNVKDLQIFLLPLSFIIVNEEVVGLTVGEIVVITIILFFYYYFFF